MDRHHGCGEHILVMDRLILVLCSTFTQQFGAGVLVNQVNIAC
jgi:hypothetical protein